MQMAPDNIQIQDRVVRQELVRDLQELIAALERRVPHIDRLGETEIAHDAATLKCKAEKRLAQLAADLT